MTCNCGPLYLVTLTFPHPMFVYGNETERETSLETVFEKVFPIHGTSSSDTSIDLRCFDHVKTNILKKSTELKVPSPKHT